MADTQKVGMTPLGKIVITLVVLGLIGGAGYYFRGVIFPGGSGHDAGGFYTHTGLCTFTNLPAETKFIQLLARGVSQETEGIQVYLGGTASTVVPIPATAPLLATGVALVLARVRRRLRARHDPEP